MRRLVVSGLGAALTSALLVAAPGVARADGKTATSCNPSTYKTHYRVTVSTKAPAITHLSTFSFAPGYRRTTERTASKQQVLSAAVRYSSSASVEAGLPGKILASASAQTKMSLAANGKRTTTSNVKITDYISNPTRHNAQFVFYKGQTKATGSFVKYACRIYYLPGQNYGPAFVTTTSGTWRSFAVPGEGALRCGAGTTNLGALARAALRVGCAA